MLVYMNLGVAISAAIAAILWFCSAIVKVKFDETPDANGMIPGGIVDDQNNDILASQARGNRLSAFAAGMAGLSAALQAIVVWLTPT